MKKNLVVLSIAAIIACGCGANESTVPAAGAKATAKMLPSGGAVLPGGVPLPPAAVQAGAANSGKK